MPRGDRYFLGIEIGGTKLQIGLGRGDGHLEGLWREPIDVAGGPEGIREQIARAAPALLKERSTPHAHLAGVGVGFGGPVDDGTATIIKSHQIEGWDNFPLAKWISQILALPAVLGNDADVAGLAEALFGAGKGVTPVFYITIGSGIGGGLILSGEIYRGCGRGAAEIGHLSIAGEHNGTVERKALELWSSGWSIQKAARDEVAQGWISNCFVTPEPTAEEVACAAHEGDSRAQAILNRAWNYLAEGICQVIVLLCPRRIIIGGGVSLMGEDLLFEPLRKLVAARVFEPFAGSYEIIPAALGEEVVVHGALALARKALG
jgi:glucokinase